MPRLRPEYTQAIWAMTEALQDEKQMESGLSSCLTIMTETLGCENGFAWILNHADERLYLIACAGEKDVTGISISKGQGITGSVFETGEGVVVADCSKDERFSSSVDEETGFLTNSMICVPLRTKNAIYGCIQLLNKTDGLFTEEDLHLSENLAALAAIDIEDKGYVVRLTEKKEPIISLRKVTKEYPSGEGVLRVLKGIDLDIYEGEFLVVLGESGCGKSTMLNIIGGMDALTDGQISIDGKDFSHPSEEDLTRYRRDYIGFIFQSYQLMPNLNALENVEFIAEISKEPISSEKALSLVGLSERAGNFPSQMSGGQQQRVSIARALVKNPRVILADEPTAALDFQTGQEVLMIVEDIVRNQHKTVVMITHNAEIGKMADRVVKLKSGLVSSIRLNMHPLKAAEISW